MKIEVASKPKASDKAKTSAKTESKEPPNETTDSDTSISVQFPRKIKAKAMPKGHLAEDIRYSGSLCISVIIIRS